MRKHWLAIVAIVSVMIAAGAAAGYVVQYGYCYTFASHVEPDGVITVRVGNGCIGGCYCLQERPTTPWDFGTFNLDSHLHLPDLSYSLWQFHYSDGVYPNSEGVRARMIITYFPIWCVLLPCSIAPILWLRRRRKLHGRGFPIDDTSTV